MKINVKTEIRKYSISLEEGLYSAIVGEVNPNQPEINTILTKAITYRDFEEYGRSERSIKNFYRLKDTLNECGDVLTKKGIIFQQDYNAMRWFDTSITSERMLEIVELCFSGKELNFENGDKLTLEGAIEYGTPLTLVDSKGEKIITRPVTYVKIE